MSTRRLEQHIGKDARKRLPGQGAFSTGGSAQFLEYTDSVSSNDIVRAYGRARQTGGGKARGRETKSPPPKAPPPPPPQAPEISEEEVEARIKKMEQTLLQTSEKRARLEKELQDKEKDVLRKKELLVRDQMAKMANSSGIVLKEKETKRMGFGSRAPPQPSVLRTEQKRQTKVSPQRVASATAEWFGEKSTPLKGGAPPCEVKYTASPYGKMPSKTVKRNSEEVKTAKRPQRSFRNAREMEEQLLATEKELEKVRHATSRKHTCALVSAYVHGFQFLIFDFPLGEQGTENLTQRTQKGSVGAIHEGRATVEVAAQAGRACRDLQEAHAG
jgi:hypothetical protein